MKGKEAAAGAGLSEEARKARNKFYSEWRKKNRAKVREYQARYWEKKAKSAGAE